MIPLAGLIGFDGMKIRRFICTTPSSSSITLFNGVSKGIVFVIENRESNPGNRGDAMINVVSANYIRTTKSNTGDAASYQSYSIENGSIKVTNTGYGVGNFAAFFIGE